ncbi:MAG: DUF2784 domain-containing protein [Syntrophales bacterium]
MTYRLLADLVVIIHSGFVLFAVLGGFLVLWRVRWAWVHLPAFLWAAFIELSGGICPLTPLEDRLRLLGGQEVYGGDFIDRFVMPLLYPDGLTREYQLLLGGFVLLLNAAIYAVRWDRARRTKTGQQPYREVPSARTHT